MHYGSRGALHIEGLGPRTARQLVSQGLVHDVADLYALDADSAVTLEGFARRSAEALCEAIARSRSPALDRFLYALGIPQVGRRTAQLLAAEFASLGALERARAEALERIPGIGPEVARAIVRFFRDPENRRVLRALARRGVQPQSIRKRRSSAKLAGKTFAFTGRLGRFTRAQAREAVEALGARAAANLSGTTAYLVAGEAPGRKIDEARRRGVRILDEQAFARLIR